MEKNYFIFLITFLVLLVFFIFNLAQIKEIEAGTGDNVSGYAWSENIGWISFNCTNQNSCSQVDYGVSIDGNGNFSGYAWSENIGWIRFDPPGPYPESPNYSAKLDLVTNQITGWARACAGTVNGDCNSATQTDGWDGWIKMAGTASNGSSYGVFRSGCNLIDYAWGSDVVGWINFRGSNYGVVTTLCGTNQPPSADNLQASQPDYCVISWPSAILSWQFTDPGDTQSAYQIQIDNNSNFSSPEVDSGKVMSSSNSYAALPGMLSYNTTYYWRLMVWDSNDLASVWILGPGFATPGHAYPTADFSWTPQNPLVNETTQFTDQSTVYGGTTKSSFYWVFQDGSPANSVLQNPLTEFLSVGDKSVTFRVTDSGGLSCQTQKTVNIRIPLPVCR